MIGIFQLAALFLSFLNTPLHHNSLMYSIYQMESSGGVNSSRRFEPAFLEKYGNKGLMPKLRRLYGDKNAASSYGDYQIMLLVAWQNGFEVTPYELEDKYNNAIIANSIIEKYCDRYGYIIAALPKIYKRWNGSEVYAKKAIEYYIQFPKTDNFPPN